jgi:hypothetical protein
VAITKWMSFEGGVDLCAATKPGLAQPNVLLHVGRMVHTPVGSAPSGMVLWQPDPNAPPALIGFLSASERVGRWFGPNLFAGTPFQDAPFLKASIDVTIGEAWVGARVRFGDHSLSSRLELLKPLEKVERAPAPMTPFWQQGLEAIAARATFTIDGQQQAIVLPPVGISGGAPAVFAPAGWYAR